MVTAILFAFLGVVAIFLIAVAWGANARRRAGQSGAATSANPSSPKIGRASGPD